MQNIPLSSDYDTTISLLNVYLAEWIQRDQIIWSQIFKFYYAILIVILLPNIPNLIEPPLNCKIIVICRLIGLFLSVVFLYVSLGYAVRLHLISKSYRLILNKLPKEYRQVRFDNITFRGKHIAKIFKPRLGYIICVILFITLFLLSLLFIAFDINLLTF